MRRILSATYNFSNNGMPQAPLQIKSLLLKPSFFRSDRNRKLKKQKQQRNINPSKQQNDPSNKLNSYQHSKKIAGPNKILQQIKNGNTKHIPLYLKYFYKNQNLLTKGLNNQNKSRKQHSYLQRKNILKQHSLLNSVLVGKKKQFDFRKYRNLAAFIAFILLGIYLNISQYPRYSINLKEESAQLMGEQQVRNIVNQLTQIYFWRNEMGQNIKLKFKDSTFTGKNQTIIKKTLEKLGFQQQTHVLQFISPAICPNMILAGLEQIQKNKEPSQWVKSKIPNKKYTFTDAMVDTLFLATPFLSLGIIYYIFTRSSPDRLISGLTQNKKNMKVQSMKNIKVRFKDVAGMEGAKKQITQFVDFLKHGQKYVEMGAKIPKGALLTGPPGTGKTMLAKACAGEAETSFFYVSGSEFVQMFVGLGSSRVRQLFAKARQEAPSIIFIDQIDAIGKKRQTSRNQQKDSTLNQLLVEMDGFSSRQTVIVLAATNRKDVLDSALTRPGRFDRMVEVTLPQIHARQEIFMVHLSPLKVNPNKPLSSVAKRLSQLTPGFSGADIANLCNEAAIIATRKKRQYIEDEDFQEASERIMAGYIKKGLSNIKTRKRVAYHEAGHAVCGWFLKGGDPLVKLTIIPRSKGALGYAQYLPKSAYIRTKDQLIDQVSIMLGGTTSQQVFLGNMSSGNSDDLQKVYSLTRRMVTQFGMGKTTYNLTLDEETYVKKESQSLCNVMDEQIMQIVDEASKRARNIIEEKRQIIENLAQQLLVKQTLNSEDIVRIMGERPIFEEVKDNLSQCLEL